MNKTKYLIFWHGNLLRVFTNQEQAVGCYLWFKKFLLPSKLRFATITEKD